MIFMLRLTALFLVSVLLTACGNLFGQEAKRGGGLEIPNGVASVVVVRLTDSAGMALGKTHVQLVAGESWAKRIQAGRTVILDTATTDSQGLVRLDVTESRVFLLAKYGSQGIHLALQPRDSTGHNRANPLPVPMRSLQHLALQALAHKDLAVFGTPWHFGATASGSAYHLDSVPQGEYMPVGVDDAGLQMGQTLTTVLFDTTTDVSAMVFSNPNNLMLTNFENRRLLSIWDPMHVGGYWWVTARVNEIASWDHLGIKTLDNLLDSANGNVFAGINVNFLDTGVTVANFGLDFSTQPVNTNLSKATSVSFLARGTGTWVVYVQTQNPDGSNSLRWMYPLVLASQWTQYEIPLSKFICENDPSIAWNQSTRLGTNLFWQTRQNGNIQVDDIVLEGLRFEDWVDP